MDKGAGRGVCNVNELAGPIIAGGIIGLVYLSGIVAEWIVWAVARSNRPGGWVGGAGES